MTATVQAEYKAQARIMKALAHPTRLFLVDQLSNGPRCVGDLSAMVDADISTISKHLLVLKNAGVVADDRMGSQVFYTLRTPCVCSWQSCVEGVLEAEARRARLATG